MPRRAGRLVLAFLVLVPSLGEATLQDRAPSTRRDTYWVGAGLGAGSGDFAGHLNGSYQFGANLLSIRTAATAGIFDDEDVDMGLLYGRATRGAGDRHLLAAALGVALVRGCDGGGLGGCSATYTVVGLPFEFQASYRPGKVLGIGLHGFANLNDRRSFAGATLGLQIGRLR